MIGQMQTSDDSNRTHPAFSRVFAPGHLTFGLIAPLEGYPDRMAPTMQDHVDLARQADIAGFSAIWLRDVPLLDPEFGDAGQMFDPLVYAAHLGVVTQRICIGTAGVVLTLRDPLMVAKQAATLDVLLQGRFLLGLSTGDRPSEYPAFSREFDNRAERFREGCEVLRIADPTGVSHVRVLPLWQARRHPGFASKALVYGNADACRWPLWSRHEVVGVEYGWMALAPE